MKPYMQERAVRVTLTLLSVALVVWLVREQSAEIAASVAVAFLSGVAVGKVVATRIQPLELQPQSALGITLLILGVGVIVLSARIHSAWTALVLTGSWIGLSVGSVLLAPIARGSRGGHAPLVVASIACGVLPLVGVNFGVLQLALVATVSLAGLVGSWCGLLLRTQRYLEGTTMAITGAALAACALPVAQLAGLRALWIPCVFVMGVWVTIAVRVLVATGKP